jgi:hypothetical protein
MDPKGEPDSLDLNLEAAFQEEERLKASSQMTRFRHCSVLLTRSEASSGNRKAGTSVSAGAETFVCLDGGGEGSVSSARADRPPDRALLAKLKPNIRHIAAGSPSRLGFLAGRRPAVINSSTSTHRLTSSDSHSLLSTWLLAFVGGSRCVTASHPWQSSVTSGYYHYHLVPFTTFRQTPTHATTEEPLKGSLVHSIEVTQHVWRIHCLSGGSRQLGRPRLCGTIVTSVARILPKAEAAEIFVLSV